MLGLWERADRIALVGVCCLLLFSTKASANQIAIAPAPEEIINLPNVKSLQNSPDLANNSLVTENRYLAQVNSVQQLQDIKPTDWAYEALRGLIDRYGCIDGFPDQTYRGGQTISRAEFVAGLDACLNKVESILTNFNQISQTDVETILRLMQEYQSELAIIQGRADGSQARLQDLESTRFSTTTKLKGEAVIGLSDVLSNDAQTSSVLNSRLRLDLQTSFSGEDLLLTRLSRNDFSGFVEEVSIQRLAFADAETDSLQIEQLHYSFGVGNNLDFIIGAKGVAADDIAETINVLDGDGGFGAISAFGTRNPIYYHPADAGVGVVHRPIDQIQISAGYLAASANEADSGSGLFNGAYSALGQITITPLESLSLAATYIHSYNQSDTEGTDLIDFESQTVDLFGVATPTVSNSYGLELSWAISDRIILGGWGGLSKVSNLSTLDRQIDRETQEVWNWAATLAFPDLGSEGSLGGIVVGSEPAATNTIDNSENSDRSLHLEAFYQYQLNDNIAITPGVVWITEPDDTNIEDSNDLVIGTIRTTFSF